MATSGSDTPRKAITHDVYDGWQSIQGVKLSDDGGWLAYTLQPQGLTHVMAGVPPEGLKAFAADRAPFTAGMTRQTPADATVALKAYLGRLEDQLADGRAFLCGAQPSIADFSVAPCLL